jgi:hypothetical protein
LSVVSATDCTSAVSLSTTVIVPVNVPIVEDVDCTEIVQIDCAASVAPHVFVCDQAGPLKLMFVKFTGAVP